MTLIEELIANGDRLEKIIRSFVRYSYEHEWVGIGFAGHKEIREALYEREVIKMKIKQAKKLETKI